MTNPTKERRLNSKDFRLMLEVILSKEHPYISFKVLAKKETLRI
jgi:hypothetical protein